MKKNYFILILDHSLNDEIIQIIFLLFIMSIIVTKLNE